MVPLHLRKYGNESFAKVMVCCYRSIDYKTGSQTEFNSDELYPNVLKVNTSEFDIPMI